MAHDAVVRMVLVRVMALVEYQQREKTQGLDVILEQRVLHDLRRHHEHVVLGSQLSQR